MKLNDIQSKALLPRFANSYTWVQNAFDIIVKKVFERAKSIDAPLTMESIQALNETELQALYEQYGIAEYYPDLSRETRDNMLYEMCRIYRYLGTPKAIEILCKYIFDGTPLDVTVLDNLAFDDNGNLIDASLLDIFDIAISPQDAVLDEWAHNRILANIIRFSRNSQALRDIYYDYIEQFDLSVYMAVHSSNNPVVMVDWENDELAVLPEFNFIVIDKDSGQIINGSTVSGMEYGTVDFVVMPDKDSDMVYGTVGHVTMDDAKQMITVYETVVSTESFYFTELGRNETANTNISHADIPVYLEDGTAPAADTPYNGSVVLAFMDVTGNTKQADGESLYVANNALRLDAPDTDEGEQWAALVERIETVTELTAYFTNAGAAGTSNRPIGNGASGVYLYDGNGALIDVSAYMAAHGLSNYDPFPWTITGYYNVNDESVTVNWPFKLSADSGKLILYPFGTCLDTYQVFKLTYTET